MFKIHISPVITTPRSVSRSTSEMLDAKLHRIGGLEQPGNAYYKTAVLQERTDAELFASELSALEASVIRLSGEADFKAKMQKLYDGPLSVKGKWSKLKVIKEMMDNAVMQHQEQTELKVSSGHFSAVFQS